MAKKRRISIPTQAPKADKNKISITERVKIRRGHPDNVPKAGAHAPKENGSRNTRAQEKAKLKKEAGL